MEQYQSSDERYAEAERRERIAQRRAAEIRRNNPTATPEEMAMMLDEVTTFAELDDATQKTSVPRLGFLGLFGRRAK